MSQTVLAEMETNMANSTFSGPVRSENGHKVVSKNTSTGAFTEHATLNTATGAVSSGTTGSLLLNASSTNTATLQTYQATITVANGATTGKEASIAMPANFIPMCVMVNVTTASTNNVNLVDIGDDGDTDSYVDGIAVAVNSTGFKGVFGCNGVRGITGLTGATSTADEVEVVVSGDPGSATVLRLTFVGVTGA